MTHILGTNAFLDSGYIEKKRAPYDEISCLVKKYLETKERISQFFLSERKKIFSPLPQNLDDPGVDRLMADVLMTEAKNIKKYIELLISEKKILKKTEYVFDGYNCWRIKKYTINQNTFTKYDRFFCSYKPFFSNKNASIYKLLHHNKFKVLKKFHSIEKRDEAIKRNTILYKSLAEQGSMALFMKFKGECSNTYISKSYEGDLLSLLGNLSNKKKLFYIAQILSILLYMQKINFLHGDLKPENFFVDQTNNDFLVVGDLDGGVFLGKTPQEIAQTAYNIYEKKITISITNSYFSPHIEEMFSQQSLAPEDIIKCCRTFDIYSGCVIINEILIGRTLTPQEQWPEIISEVQLLDLTDAEKYNLLLLIHTMKDPFNCDLEKQIGAFNPSIVKEVKKLMAPKI